MAVQIRAPFGYMRLDSWVLSKIVQLATINFCRRFLNYQNDPCRRQFDQTTLAARSVSANIAEGSSRHDTSRETEIRLLDVSRGSISEVLDDFMFFIMDKGHAVWEDDNPIAQQIRSTRLDKPYYGNNYLHSATVHIHNQYKKFAQWIDSTDMIVAANAIIILCLRITKMLHNQMDYQVEDFSQSGGFTENMTQTRLQAKKQQNIEEGAPLCPVCGEVMIRRTINKGVFAGRQFWGCSNFPKTRCPGKMDIMG